MIFEGGDLIEVLVQFKVDTPFDKLYTFFHSHTIRLL